MARIVLTDVQVLFGTAPVPTDDFGDHVASVTLSSTYDVVETTAFDGGSVPFAAKSRQAGLVDNSVTFEFHQDFAATEIESYLNDPTPASSKLGTELYVRLVPTSGAVSATNPAYEFVCIVSEWTPLSGAVGELATASVTWPITGKVDKIVAP